MLDPQQATRLALPKGWPKHVRSSVLHAISLANFSLTFTRSWAANSFNARIRLKQENDRLRQEVALLVEVQRIKDRRIQQIPPHRRPYYPPILRLAILADRFQVTRSVLLLDRSVITRLLDSNSRASHRVIPD